MIRVRFLLDEEFIVIKKYPDYAVSNHGRVRRITSAIRTRIGKILNPALTNNGYLICTLYGNNKCKNFYIHRLVTEVFIGPCPEGKEVNHIDGNKQNNYYRNLEYVTHSKNMKYAHKLGLIDTGEKHSQSKLTNKQVIKIREMYKTGKYNYKQLAKRFEVHHSCIGFIIRKDSWKCVS